MTDDGLWLWAWWFADTRVRGKLLLERFAEYVASSLDDGELRQYTRVRDCSQAEGNLDASTVPMPEEVLTEAAVKVRREALP